MKHIYKPNACLRYRIDGDNYILIIHQPVIHSKALTTLWYKTTMINLVSGKKHIITGPQSWVDDYFQLIL